MWLLQHSSAVYAFATWFSTSSARCAWRSAGCVSGMRLHATRRCYPHWAWLINFNVSSGCLDLDDLKESAALKMGQIQRLLGDVAFKSGPMKAQICMILQTCAVQAMRFLSVTPSSLTIDGAWLGVNGRDERSISKHALGQLRGSGRSDLSFLAEESLERIFGLKINEKFWQTVNAIFTITADTDPSVIDAAKYPSPASGLDRHVAAVAPSPLFIHSGLLCGEREEGIEFKTFDCSSAALRGSSLSNELYISVNPEHRSRLANDQAATVLVPPTGPMGTALARFLPLGAMWGQNGIPRIQATSCSVRHMDDKQSSSSRVNAAYRDFDSPAWAMFTNGNGDPLALFETVYKLDFLRFGELETSDIYYYQYHVVEETVRRCINAQTHFAELVPYCFMLKAFGEGALVPTMLAVERPVINLMEARRKSKRVKAPEESGGKGDKGAGGFAAAKAKTMPLKNANKDEAEGDEKVADNANSQNGESAGGTAADGDKGAAAKGNGKDK